MNDAEIVELLTPASNRPVPPMAFSLDEVVRRGTVVRRRRAAGAVAGVLAVVLIVAGGVAVLRPAGHTASPGVSMSTPPLGDQLDTLMAQLGVPPGATLLAASPVSSLDDPDLSGVKGTPVRRTRWWTSPMSPAAMDQWVQKQQPADTNGSYGDSSKTLYRQDFQIGEGDPAYGPELEFTIVPYKGGSATRVDAWARQAPPREPDTLLSDSVKSVVVTDNSAGSAAYSSRLSLTFGTGPARSLATVLNQLSAAGADALCSPPATAPTYTFHDGRHVLQFTYAERCSVVGLKVDGKPRKALEAYGPELAGVVAGLHLPKT